MSSGLRSCFASFDCRGFLLFFSFGCAVLFISLVFFFFCFALWSFLGFCCFLWVAWVILLLCVVWVWLVCLCLRLLRCVCCLFGELVGVAVFLLVLFFVVGWVGLGRVFVVFVVCVLCGSFSDILFVVLVF